MRPTPHSLAATCVEMSETLHRMRRTQREIEDICATARQEIASSFGLLRDLERLTRREDPSPGAKTDPAT